MLNLSQLPVSLMEGMDCRVWSRPYWLSRIETLRLGKVRYVISSQLSQLFPKHPVCQQERACDFPKLWIHNLPLEKIHALSSWLISLDLAQQISPESKKKIIIDYKCFLIRQYKNVFPDNIYPILTIVGSITQNIAWRPNLHPTQNIARQ